MHQAFNYVGNLLALLAHGSKLLGQTRYDDGGGLRNGYDRNLFAECLNDFGRKAIAHALASLARRLAIIFSLVAASSLGDGYRSCRSSARRDGPGMVPDDAPVRDGSG